MEVGSSCQNSNVDKIFRLLDTGNKGYITRQDAADGLDEIQQPPTGDATAPATGASGPAGGGVTTTTVASDPADTNQDGKVSMQEELAYILKQYTSDSVAQS